MLMLFNFLSPHYNLRGDAAFASCRQSELWLVVVLTLIGVRKLRSQNSLTTRVNWCCKNLHTSYSNPIRAELGLPFPVKRIIEVDESRTRAQ